MTSIKAISSLLFINLLINPTFAQESTIAQVQTGLMGTSWQMIGVQSMNDQVKATRFDDSSQIILNLWPGGLVTMKLNCNNGFGDWSFTSGSEMTSGQLSIENLVSTQSLCRPPRVGEIFASQVNYIRGYYLEGDKLYLSLMADGGVFEFQLHGNLLVSPEEGGPRNWEVYGEVNLHNEPNQSSTTQTIFQSGTILDNLGCLESENSNWWCDVQELRGGPRGYILAQMLRPAFAPNRMVMTGVNDSALKAGKDEFDATGTLPCKTGKSTSRQEYDCKFGVARAGGGYSTLVVTKPDGNERIIFFSMGIPTGISSSQADGYPKFKAKKVNDTHIITIGDEKYEIPEAAILGG